jgi:hypothetical protein
MKNKIAKNKSNERKEDDKLKNKNETASTSNLWQQYSPMAWSEMYNEYINYTRRMTEIFGLCHLQANVMWAYYLYIYWGV